jgi:polyhydroxyalkanoate synthesis regulator phasin
MSHEEVRKLTNSNRPERNRKPMKSKKIFIMIGSATLILMGLLVGAFFAGPLIASASSSSNQSASAASAATGTNTYCTQYQQNLANELHVSVSTLQQDQKTALDATINQMVKDGKLTQSQATAIEARVNAHQACTGKGNRVGHFITGQFLQKYRGTIENSIASGLHLTTAQLTTQLQSGQSLSQIATTQHISATQLQTIVVNAVQSALKQAVSKGDLTQAQANTFSQLLSSHPQSLNHILNAHVGKHGQL